MDDNQLIRVVVLGLLFRKKGAIDLRSKTTQQTHHCAGECTEWSILI